MIERRNAVLTAGAKVGAVALAMSVGGYLIVSAQRRANPQQPESAPVAAGATPQAIEGAADGITPASVEAATNFLMSSKSAVLEPPEPASEAIPIYFAGSKSMVITDTSIVGANGTTADGWNLLPPPATDAPVYLPSSKSLSPGSIKYPPPAPKQSATPVSGPQQP